MTAESASLTATDSYCVSPLVRIDRAHGGPRISAGDGADRETVAVDNEALLSCLTRFAAPQPSADLRGEIVRDLGVTEDQAGSLFDSLVAANVLVPAEEADLLREAGRFWESHGWRDAFDFHFATYGTKFDRRRKQEYEDTLRSLFDDVHVVGPQPPSAVPREGERLDLAPHVREVDTSLGMALSSAVPVNVFTEFGLELWQLATLLTEAHGVHMVRNLVLGEHLFKASPSGGARHPLEVYLAAREVAGLAPGVYHFDAKDAALVRIGDEDAISRLDATCFDKGGIKTSSAVLFLTYRLPRHAWKYRYPWTYRAVLLEIGHNVQTTRIAATAVGLEVYYNPAIHDGRVRDLLGITDDCDEAPVISIGLGRGGTV